MNINLPGLVRRHLFVVCTLLVGCIGEPPAATDAGAANNRDDGSIREMDSGRDRDRDQGGQGGRDAAVDASNADVSPDASDTGAADMAGDAADAGTGAFDPLPTIAVAWIGDSADTNSQSEAFYQYLTFALNARIGFESPDTLNSADYDLVVVAAEADPYEDDLIDIAAVPIPLMAIEQGSWNNLLIATGSDAWQDGKSLSIINTSQQRAGGLAAGTQVIYPGEAGRFDARPDIGPGAEVIANNELGYATYLTYETGALMLDDVQAAARRVAFGLIQPTRYNRSGFLLFEAAVEWAIDDPKTPKRECHLIHDGDLDVSEYVVAGRLRLHGCNVTMVPVVDGATIDASDLVVVHPDVDQKAVGTALSNLAAPVVVLMAGVSTVEGAHLAAEAVNTQVVNVSEWTVRPQAPAELAADYSGQATVVASEAPFLSVDLTTLPPDALLVAGDQGTGGLLYWAVEEGDALSDGFTAPARRVVLAVPRLESATLEDPYFDLLDAAIDWATTQPSQF
jgi:hypothetical protein